MNILKRQWEKFKAKSILGKTTDILFLVFIVMMLTSDGRILFQRLMLKTGLFGDFHSNESQVLSSETLAWNFEDENGEVRSLNDFEGQTIFLNYWATWCGPCIKEMPDLMNAEKKLKDSDVSLFLVSDEDMSVISKFVDNNSYTLNFIKSNVSNEKCTKCCPKIISVKNERQKFIIVKNSLNKTNIA